MFKKRHYLLERAGIIAVYFVRVEHVVIEAVS